MAGEPAGHPRLLAAKQGGGTGDNFTTTVFDDEAATPITAAPRPSPARSAPRIRSCAFDGQDPNGTWTLEVLDATTGNTGTLADWSLRFDIGPAPAALIVTTLSPLPPGRQRGLQPRPHRARRHAALYLVDRRGQPARRDSRSHPATGVISGTPSAGGLSVFRVQVTDAASQTATKDLSLTIRSDSRR